MTSTTAAPEVKAAQDPLRILQIAANLLPAEIVDARRAAKLRWLILALLVLVVGALVFWDVHARQQTSSAQHDLKQLQSKVQAINAQKQQYAVVNTPKNEGAAINAQLGTLLTADLPWWQLVPTLYTTAASAGTELTNVSGTLDDPNGTSSSTSTQLPGITDTAAIGNLTITGLAVDQSHVAAYLDVLANTHGLADPFLTSSATSASATGQGGKYQFTIQVEFTSALLGGRYTTGGK